MKFICGSFLMLLVTVLAAGFGLAAAPAAAPGVPGAPDAAAPASPQPAAPLAASAAPFVYTVRTGDTLRITTVGELTYTGLFRVGADGSVQFRDQMVGQVALEQLTLAQAQARLTERFSQFLKSPVVTVELSRFTVLVSGVVRTPGEYEVDNGALVMEAVTRAGFGTAPAPQPLSTLEPASQSLSTATPAANQIPPVPVFVATPGTSLDDLEHVYVRRANGEVKTLNLRAYIEKGDVTQNIPLLPGDTIAVGYLGAAPEHSYRVSGAVRVPGQFWLQREGPIRMQDAIQAAGGATDEADLQHCAVVHPGGARFEVDATVLSNSSAVGVAPGDEVIVPLYPLTVQVLGAVGKPGRYRVPEKATCLDAVTVAGGFTADAILQDTSIVRGQPATRVAADLQKTLNGQDMKQNLPLRDGDILFIPRRNPSSGNSTWSAVASAASILRWILP
ncbi:MAG: SLBB domain-containing protein [Armatimonadota bacterium]